jgi:formate hydrogenlyase subunit 3/multisubunit Na+/H+ antiporter MnhD subunit
MIASFLYTLPVAFVAYFLLRKRDTSLRVGLSLAIWLIPPLALIIWVLIIGDQAPPDAVLVVPAPTSAQ